MNNLYKYLLYYLLVGSLSACGSAGNGLLLTDTATAITAADNAEEAARDAQAASNAAETAITVDEAQGYANEAAQNAKDAAENAENAKVAANAAVDAGAEDAQTAQDAADEAQKSADKAQISANEAQEAVNKLQVVVDPEPIDPEPLTDQVEVFDIPLSGTANNGTTITNTIYPATRPDGGMTLAWNEKDQGHLLRLDAEMKPDTSSKGGEWDLDGLMIVHALGLEDDGVAVLAFNYSDQLSDSGGVDRHLRLYIYDSEGNVTRETSIVGGKGIGVGKQWFNWASTRSAAMVAFDGRYGIFIAISDERTESSGVHQGDLYIEVDEDGNIDESTRDNWSTSHSNRQHLIVDENRDNWRLVVGDANPFGILFEVQSPYSVDDTTVWPDEEQQAIGKELANSSVSAGDLCGFQLRDGRFFGTLASGREQPFDPNKDSADILLLSWPMGVTQGDPISETWLTETANVPEVCPTLTAIGDDYQLIAWGVKGESTAILVLIDTQGNLVSEPVESDLPYHKYSIAIPRLDGGVVWTYAERNAKSVKLVIVNKDWPLSRYQKGY